MSSAGELPTGGGSAAADKRWLFGPTSDLVLGCGVGYAVFIALVPWLGFELGALSAVGLVSSFLLATPHYGATLLRVYADRSDLQKYGLFTIYASALVWLGFVVGLYDLRVGSFLITLYFTWSPWHYAGQNYGLAVMFLRRRGVPLPDRTKKLLYASFLLSYLLTFVMMHQAGGAQTYGVGNVLGTAYGFMSLGLPAVNETVGLFSLVFVAYLGTTVAAAVLLLRTTSARELIPVACLAVTQALWFVVPKTWGWVTGVPLESETVAFLFVWAILGHSVQYLWVTSYFAVGTAGGLPRWKHLAGSAAAGALVWTLPAIVFSAQGIGNHPYNLGLFLLVASAANLQHFVLDGAIWKLRDTGVGAILLAQPKTESEGGAGATWPPWLRGATWALGLGMFFAGFVGAWEAVTYESALRAGDVDRSERARARLVALGRDDPRFHLYEAQRALAAGELDAAADAAARSLELYPTADGWFTYGVLHHNAGRVEEALASYHASISMDPNKHQAWHRAGILLAGRGQVEAALDALARAAQLAPEDAAIASDLAQLRNSAPPQDGDSASP